MTECEHIFLVIDSITGVNKNKRDMMQFTFYCQKCLKIDYRFQNIDHWTFQTEEGDIYEP